jgi:hypothetical protein
MIELLCGLLFATSVFAASKHEFCFKQGDALAIIDVQNDFMDGYKDTKGKSHSKGSLGIDNSPEIPSSMV